MKLKKASLIFLVPGLILTIVLTPCTVCASGEHSAQSYLDSLTSKRNINGVVYVTKDGEVLCEYANGMANTSEGKKITTDTMFPIGSVSKQFCAASILLLKEQGKINVDEKISKFFPEYEIGADITVKDLLTNRSGIRNYQEGIFDGEYALSTEASEAENQQKILDWIYSKELEFIPNTKYEYSNTNFFLLSLIAEQVSNQSYTDFVKENIFTPLEMTNSGFYEELYNHPDLAEHRADPTEAIDAYFKGYTQGAGDLVSNAKDIDKWLTSLRKHTILSEESIKEMTANYSQNTGYGYGIGILSDGTLSHNGNIGTYVCVASTNIERELNVFVISNNFVYEESAVLEFSDKLLKRLQLICGDVTNDKKITIKDTTLIQKFCAKFFSFSETEMLIADVNNDSKVNVKDATAIQKHLAKIETNLPIGNTIY